MYMVTMAVRPDQEGDSFGNAFKITGSKCEAEEAYPNMTVGVVPPGGYGKSSGNVLNLPGAGAKAICDRMGNCYYLFRSAAEEDLFRSLIQDAIARGIRAWGGQAKFRKEACTTEEIDGLSQIPILAQELSNFCKQPESTVPAPSSNTTKKDG